MRALALKIIIDESIGTENIDESIGTENYHR